MMLSTTTFDQAAVQKSRRPYSQRITTTLVLLLCMAGASAISLFALMHNSLRLDESQTVWQSSHTFLGVLHVVALDVHVPLYHVIMHFWIFAFGHSVMAVRLPSLIFFLLTIPIIYKIANQLVPYRWALFATALFSFSPFLDWYATEARMYTLLILMASLSQYFFIKILKTGHGWVGFTASALIGAYSHYFFMFVLASEGIYFLINRKKFAPGSFKKLLYVAIATIAVLSPWLYYFESLGAASTTRPMLPKPSSVDFSNVYSQFLFGFQNNSINTILLSSWPLIMLVALIAVKRSKRITPELGFIASMAIIPVALAYVISIFITPFFLSRYMVACVAPLILLIVWLISRYSHLAGRLAAIGIMVAFGLSSVQQAVSASTPVKEDYRGAVSYINQHAAPQDLVVLSAPFTIYPVEYYYTGPTQIVTLPEWDGAAAGGIPAFNKDKLPGQVASYNEHHRYIYLLLSQNQGYETTIKNYYQDHFKELNHKRYSQDLTLYTYQVGYYTVPPLAQQAKTVK